MKRSGPPKRRTPMRRDGPGARAFAAKRPGTPARKRRMRRRSERMEKLYAEKRRPYVEQLVAAGVRCEVCPVLAEAGFTVHCTGGIDGLHERRKRGAGGSLINRDNLIPACAWGNGFIEDEAGPVRERTGDALVVRPGDPDWERFARRRDREADE